MIFFHSDSPGLGLEDAERLLSDRGLQVTRKANALSVRWDDGPELSVTRSAEPHVAEEAVEIAEGTPFAAELSRCDARFEIGIEDLDEVLDEINTLIEVQCTLQDATGGYLFNSWNGNLSGPERTA
jgi:hypothetical protein